MIHDRSNGAQQVCSKILDALERWTGCYWFETRLCISKNIHSFADEFCWLIFFFN